MMLRFDVGRLSVAVEAENLPRPLSDLFGAFPQSQERHPRLRFVVDEHSETQLAKGSYLVAGARVQSDSFSFTDYASPLGYVARRERDGGLVFNCNLNDSSRISGWRSQLRRVRFFHPFYLNRAGRSLEFLYALFQYALQIALLQERCSLVHASCVEKAGRAVLFPAWGGVGKTSLLYQLVARGSWNFLADDMAILSADGDVFMNPTPIAVYPYNLKTMPEIEKKVLGGESLASRLQWRLFTRLRGADGVGRRVSPANLFGRQRICARATLDKVVYLVRSSGTELRHEACSAADLAARVTCVLLAEIRQFRHELQAWNSVPNCSVLPFVWQLAEQIQSVTGTAFENQQRWVLSIPATADPVAIRQYLEEHLLTDGESH